MAGHQKVAVISGFGPGLARAVAQKLLTENYTVAGLSRSGKTPLNHAQFHNLKCDVTDLGAVTSCINQITQASGKPDVWVHNAAQLHIGEFLETPPETFTSTWQVSCLAAVYLAQEIFPLMLEKGGGTVIFSGATASIRGGAQFSAFASAKFAMRGLAQSLARAYGPQGIHVVHTILDGVIWGDRAEHQWKMDADKCIQPQNIAAVYLDLINQKSSAWTHEIDLRPASEVF